MALGLAAVPRAWRKVMFGETLLSPKTSTEMRDVVPSALATCNTVPALGLGSVVALSLTVSRTPGAVVPIPTFALLPMTWMASLQLLPSGLTLT